MLSSTFSSVIKLGVAFQVHLQCVAGQLPRAQFEMHHASVAALLYGGTDQQRPPDGGFVVTGGCVGLWVVGEQVVATQLIAQYLSML